MDAIFKKESTQGAGSIWQSMFDERCSEIGPLDSDPPSVEIQTFLVFAGRGAASCY